MRDKRQKSATPGSEPTTAPEAAVKPVLHEGVSRVVV